MKRICIQCGLEMIMTKIKKGSFYRRSLWRYECKCGYSETEFGRGQYSREDAIAEGLFDDELDIPKYPTE